MQAGDKVVCVDKTKPRLSFGETYTIESIAKDYFESSILYVEGIGEGFCVYRFRLLEEMQNTNFIGLVQ